MKLKHGLFLAALISVVAVALPFSQAAVSSGQIEQSVNDYVAAWNEPDAAARMALLEKAWATDATYTDPTANVKGRDGLSNLISGFLNNEQTKGASIVRKSGIDIHHRSFRFAWDMLTADGTVAASGIDYGEFGDDGELKKIVGFFGPMPAKK